MQPDAEALRFLRVPRLDGARGRGLVACARWLQRGCLASFRQPNQDVVVISCCFQVRGNSELALLALQLGSWAEVWWYRSETLGECDQEMVS